MFNGKINYKLPFSIAMLNYQRVQDLASHSDHSAIVSDFQKWNAKISELTHALSLQHSSHFNVTPANHCRFRIGTLQMGLAKASDLQRCLTKREKNLRNLQIDCISWMWHRLGTLWLWLCSTTIRSAYRFFVWEKRWDEYHPSETKSPTKRHGTVTLSSRSGQGYPRIPKIPLAGYPTKSLSRKAVNSGPFKSWTLVISFPHLWVPESQTLGVFFHLFASFCPVSKKVTKCNKIKNNFIESKELTSGSTCIGLESTVSRWPSSTYRFKVARIDGAAKAHHKARERVQAKARIPLMFQKGQGVNHFCSLGETQNPIEGHTSFLCHLKLLCKFGRCQFHSRPNQQAGLHNHLHRISTIDDHLHVGMLQPVGRRHSGTQPPMATRHHRRLHPLAQWPQCLRLCRWGCSERRLPNFHRAFQGCLRAHAGREGANWGVVDAEPDLQQHWWSPWGCALPPSDQQTGKNGPSCWSQLLETYYSL